MSIQLRPPRPRPALPGEPVPSGRPADRRRQVVVALVSVATAVWLVAQMTVGLRVVVRTWPVVGFPMFTENRTSYATRLLEVRTSGGRAVVAGREHFGLTELQFRALERSMVTDSGMVRPGAEDRLGRLAGVWNRARPEDPAVAITLTNLVRPLKPGAPPVSRQVVRWEAS